MKRTIVSFMVLAAVVLIVTSASSLFVNAYNSATQPWQQWLKGVQIVAIIVWESGALVAILYCIRHRFPGVSILVLGGSMLLIACMAVTMSAEFRLQAGTQESAVAKKTAEAGKIELISGELKKAIAYRDSIRAKKRLSEFDQDELLRAERQVDALKAKWEPLVEDAPAVAIPGAALIARWTGLNIADSGDLDIIANVLLWTLARVFALPLALFGVMLLQASETRQEARSHFPDETTEKVGTPTVALPMKPERGMRMPSAESQRIAEHVQKQMAQFRAAKAAEALALTHNEIEPDPDGTGTPMSKPDVKRDDTDEGAEDRKVVSFFRDNGTPPVAARAKKEAHKPEAKAEAWLADCATQTDDPRDMVSSGECWKSYLAYCRTNDKQAIHRKVFSRQIGVLIGRKAGKKRERDRNGTVFKGLRLSDPRQWQREKVVAA